MFSVFHNNNNNIYIYININYKGLIAHRKKLVRVGFQINEELNRNYLVQLEAILMPNNWILRSYL
jgi:hypothetical protein